ncbi:5'-methylthioadenosine/adenosylhomocysteine nucleosidase [Flavobacterium soyangense]|uniref:adenosylhomocysteine nucleosidase n=1 Tax=Flavobacterium soyangense TaxID=2023265 RepID=A0A930UAD9_9FLAO|nr:5'-methylthioadenosine/adenosylhomocysteine nucleosidase [Flavobacterium soyangense]MBF2708472.1 5'-methylthioadenosine/adenosylhomocysteine nucleosidase [Flavobacterium soyangense]
MKKRTIGIMGAMPEEIEGVVALLTNCTKLSMGKRTYFLGQINGIDTIVVFSRWGKVAAATTATTLIHEFKITELLFTGVAGAINADLKIGDIVLGKRLIQHDMDARPLMPQYEIPLLSQTYFESDTTDLGRAAKAINTVFENKSLHAVIGYKELMEFNITQPRLVIGDIASGDQFFSRTEQKQALNTQLPNVLCVEMEGAPVAQVCYEYEVPFIIMRTISDTADDKSHIDFPFFIKNISSKYAAEIIKNIYEQF